MPSLGFERCSKLTTRTVVSADSNELQTAAGSRVEAFADCGEVGKLVSCGFQTSDDPAGLVNAFVFFVEPDLTHSGCVAALLRTTEVGSTAGATIQSVAVCLV
jgi:hypothetical protein